MQTNLNPVLFKYCNYRKLIVINARICNESSSQENIFQWYFHELLLVKQQSLHLLFLIKQNLKKNQAHLES